LNLTVAAIQTSPIFGALRDNVDAALAQLPDDCDLAVLPELFSTGYQFRDRAEALAMAEEIPGGPTCARLREAAAGRKLHLIAGLAEKAADQLFNSAVLFRPDGTWGLYRKVHLFWNEKDIFSPGDLGLPVFPVLGTQLGIMICFDWVFPEAARSLALAGATLLAHPSNLVLPHAAWRTGSSASPPTGSGARNAPASGWSSSARAVSSIRTGRSSPPATPRRPASPGPSSIPPSPTSR
jgi:predicted amidohydrolase